MLLVMFKAAGARHAIPARDVEEIAPLVRLAPLPGAPDYLAGLMNHRGASLPVADLTFLLTGRPSRCFASTRIVIASAAPGLKAGFMVERAMRTLEADPTSLAPPGAPAAPYVMAAAPFGDDLVQVLDLSKIIPEDLAASLRAALEAA